jgi:2-polyprenyl-3-methyl-5-hydroxy-6-metoxy-1,4-benzoquinol methylase
MPQATPLDTSNGYEALAERFVATRDCRIGADTVRQWSRELAPGGAVLDLGCGHGVPISQTLADAGFVLYGIDASARMIAEFRERFPDAHVERSAVEDSAFFQRAFDGAVAWGLLFLLPGDVQAVVIGKVARALKRGGRFLFTSPREAVTWLDALTGRESVSLGMEGYRRILQNEGLTLVGEQLDEGKNHYYFVTKP